MDQTRDKISRPERELFGKKRNGELLLAMKALSQVDGAYKSWER